MSRPYHQVGPSVRVLSRVSSAPHKSARDEVDKLFSELSIDSPKDEVIVAVRKDNILATAFHPELTNDLRWHRYARLSYTAYYYVILYQILNTELIRFFLIFYSQIFP